MPVLLFILFAAVLNAQQRTGEAGVILKRVDPDYAGLRGAFTIDYVHVHLAMDAEGIPISLEAEDGLPLNVVDALAAWRYQPSVGGPFAVNLILTVRRKLDRMLEQSLRRRLGPIPEDLQDEIKAGTEMDSATAVELEKALEARPHNIGARSTLIVYYSSHGSEARVRHIAWMAKNHPDEPFLGTSWSLINAAGAPLADAAGYEQVRRIWIEQAAKNPSDDAIFGNAVNFLRVADFEIVESMLENEVGKHPMAQVWLGDLYGLAAVGVTGIDLRSGLPASAET